MIASFRCAETEGIFNGRRSRKFRAIEKVALRKLVQLDSAERLSDLALPGNQLEKLTKERAGQVSIRINKQYRICFKWNDGNADGVEIVDYHH
jgi:proteic killer suppression protein